MKNLKFLIIPLVIIMTTFCKKAPSKNFFKTYENTTWELVKITDLSGNDITANVLADSIYCSKIILSDLKVYDNSTYQAVYKDCNNCKFSSFLGFWRGEITENNGNNFYIECLDFYQGEKRMSYGTDGIEMSINESNEFSINLLKYHNLESYTIQRHYFKKM